MNISGAAFRYVSAAPCAFGPSRVPPAAVADGPGGLARGLIYSAGALWLGALLAWRQKPLM